MPDPDVRGPRRAGKQDLQALIALEHAAYDPARRASHASLRRSLTSGMQSVWVLEDGQGLCASLIIWHHKHRLRIYGVAVRPDRQGAGFGRALVAHAEALARQQGKAWLVLEADAHDVRLLDWYVEQGFVHGHILLDFYAADRPAWRMQKSLRSV